MLGIAIALPLARFQPISCSQPKKWMVTSKKEKQMASKIVEAVNPSSPESIWTQKFEIKLERTALFLSLAVAIVLASLPQRSREFFPNPSLFDALVISNMFSFAGSFGALMLRDIPRLAILRKVYLAMAMVSMASALFILACSSVLASLRLVSL